MNIHETTFPVKEIPAIGIMPSNKKDYDYDDIDNTGYKFIVREDNNQVLSCMTNDYKLVQNKDLFNLVSPIIKKENGTLTDSRIFGDGSRAKWTWQFNDNKISVGGTDKVAPTIDIWNSYDGSIAVNILAGAFRFVCSNGLVIGYILGKANFRHLKSNMSLEPDKIKASIEETVHKTKSIFTEEFPLLIDTKVKNSHVRELIKMLPNQSGDDVVDYLLNQTINNYWDLLNTATWIATHKLNRKYESTHKFEATIWPKVKKWASA